MRSDFDLARHNAPPQVGRDAGGFTLLEALIAVTIVAVLAGMTLGVNGAIRGSRGTTAVQQVVALLDTARARALAEQDEVVVAFATGASVGSSEPFRAALVARRAQRTFEDGGLQEDGADDFFEPVTEWFRLPEGYVFAFARPANPQAGVNFLAVPDTERFVELPGTSGRRVLLPCVGFGPLGQLVIPQAAAIEGLPLLVAIAEGSAAGSGSSGPGGAAHGPADCRWVAVQPASGSSLALP
jgi:type II secretory pathway pseudopilin PulG